MASLTQRTKDLILGLFGGFPSNQQEVINGLEGGLNSIETINSLNPDNNGNLTIAAGSGINVSSSGSTITVTNMEAGGSVTSVGLSAPSFLSVSGSPVTTSGTLALSYSGTALPVANGGTGLTSPGSSGNVLTSDGSVWVSSAPAAGGANTALSNLASTAVNVDIIPGINNTLVLGGSGLAWSALYTHTVLGNGTQNLTLNGNGGGVTVIGTHFIIDDSSVGTIGNVWTSTTSTGQGQWAALNLASSASVGGVLPIANGGTNNGSLSVSSGSIYYGDGSKLVALAPGSASQVLTSNGSSAPSWGSVSSGVTNVTGSGNIASSGGTTPNITFTGVLPIANGGTDNGSLAVTAGGVLYTDGTMFQNVGAGTTGQVLTSQGASAPIWAAAGGGGAVTQLASYTVSGGSTTNFSFTGITQTGYNHLKMIWMAGCDAGNIQIQMSFNAGAGGAYQNQTTYAQTSTISTNISSGGGFAELGYGGTADNAGMGEVLIPFYTNTIFSKIVLATTYSFNLGGQEQSTTQWQNTVAINEIDIAINAHNFTAGSQFILYGIN